MRGSRSRTPPIFDARSSVRDLAFVYFPTTWFGSIAHAVISHPRRTADDRQPQIRWRKVPLPTNPQQRQSCSTPIVGASTAGRWPMGAF